MSELTLLSDFSLDTTSVSNIYIDEYMSANNESQIKIYLYLLRNLSKGTSVSVITIADEFNYSVTDVERALLFMEKQGLMMLKVENNCIVGLRLLPLKKKRTESTIKDNLLIENFRLMENTESVKSNTLAEGQNLAEKQIKDEISADQIEKPEYTSAQVAEFTKKPEIEELMFVVQQYIGKPLSPADLKSMKFMNECLSFSSELIEYLVEHCADSGKKSFRYIEKVARTWYENGVSTVEEAKDLSKDVPKEVYEVFKAFSIKGGNRKPSVKEVAFVKKWMGDFAFSMDIIAKACEITIDKTHSVSFEYADAILNDWHNKGVKHLADAIALLNKKNTDSNSGGVSANLDSQRKRSKNSGNSFNNFSGRDYDFAKLEKELWSN